eukprot:5618849-Pleurochrysis_carterae.AAC.1
MPTYPPLPQCAEPTSSVTPGATPPEPPPASAFPPFVPLLQGRYDNPYFGIRLYLLPLPHPAPADDASRRCA